MGSTKAYNELVSRILSPENREKFEWSLGCILDNGPCHLVVLRGDAATGKTTLTNIVRKVLLAPFKGGTYSLPHVNFYEGDRHVSIEGGVTTYVELNTYSSLERVALVIRTTGERVPVNKHHVLTHEIDNELTDIADNCIALYRSLGESYFDTFQENN